jgi:hypothetical protein
VCVESQARSHLFNGSFMLLDRNQG